MAGTSTPLSTGTSTPLSTRVSTVLNTSSAEAVGGADALAEATDARHTWLWPLLDSSNLPPRIDSPAATEGVIIGRIAADEMTTQSCYAAMHSTTSSQGRKANVGVLGRYVNVLMVCMATFGRLPRVLPAPRDVIDGWSKMAAISRRSTVGVTGSDTIGPSTTTRLIVLAGRISGMTPLPLTTTGRSLARQLTAAIHIHRETAVSRSRCARAADLSARRPVCARQPACQRRA